MSTRIPCWSGRAVEEANLFNPAFCAALLAKTADEFTKKAGKPMPIALAFLVLPIVLHHGTREALPHSTITSLLPWIEDNREQLINFAIRMKWSLPITRETIMFGMKHQVLATDENGDLRAGAKRQSATQARTALFTSEVRECVDRAGFIGRWFATAGTPATIYSAWGVAP